MAITGYQRPAVTKKGGPKRAKPISLASV